MTTWSARKKNESVWDIPFQWPNPSQGLRHSSSGELVVAWPLSTQEVAEHWGPNVWRQSRSIHRGVQPVVSKSHGMEQDQLEALGAMAVLTEFWRIRGALEATRAERATVFIRSLPMVPHDYDWEVRLHGAQPDLVESLKGPWERLKDRFSPPMSQAEQEEGIVFPVAFPEEWLGVGSTLLLSRWPASPEVAVPGGYLLEIDPSHPLPDLLRTWFGKGLRQQWLEKHLDATLEVPVARKAAARL